MSITGDRIRELRLRQKLTLDDVARYLGVGRQAIYKYEHGTVTNIPLENIEKMAVLFNTTPGYLSGWSETSVQDPDVVAAQSRIPPPGVVVPDNALFLRVVEVLSPEDLDTLNGIYARAFEKLKIKENH